MTRERPIIFSGPMVQAIVAGTKTQTRRLVKPAIECQHDWMFGPDGDGRLVGTPAAHIDDDSRDRVCPIAVGDRLWVKETWGLCRYLDETDWHRGSVKDAGKDDLLGEWEVRYRADSENSRYAFWRPARFMFRWASRIILEVTEVRAQRLWDIAEEDAKAEGVQSFFERFSCIGRDQRLNTGELAAASPYRASFAVAWDEVNGDKASWKSNPWVWAYSFRRVA